MFDRVVLKYRPHEEEEEENHFVGLKIALSGSKDNGEDSSRDDVASDVDSTPTWPSTKAHSTSTGLDVTNTGYTGLI